MATFLWRGLLDRINPKGQLALHPLLYFTYLFSVFFICTTPLVLLVVGVEMNEATRAFLSIAMACIIM